MRSKVWSFMRVVTALYLLYLAAPIALLAVGSFGSSWTSTLLPSGFTTRWYGEVIADPSFRRAFWTSLTVALSTCIITAVIGLPLAYAIHAAATRRVDLAVRLLSLIPIAVPELVLAFGFILAFSTAAMPWLGSLWLLIAAHVVLTLPYLLNTLLADMRHLGLERLEMASASLGASFQQRLFDIVIPSLRFSLVSAMITVAALSIGEFQLSNLVAGFLNRTYPILLLQAFYGATGFACAATVVLLALATLLATLAVLSSVAARRATGAQP